MLAAHKKWLENTFYYPKLPWKLGERQAFKSAPVAAVSRTTPIFLIPPAGEFDYEAGRVLSPAEHVKGFGARLAEARGTMPVFVDAEHLDNDRHKVPFNVHPLTALLERARLARAQAWPLTAYGRSDAYQEAVAKAHLTHGVPVAIQIALADLGASSLASRLTSVCNQVSCDVRDAVLIVDGGPLQLPNETAESEFATHLIRYLNELPQLYGWSQIVFGATSLCGLEKAKVGDQKLVRRSEWHIHRQLLTRRSELYRMPAFLDYGVEYRSSLAPIKARPSAKLSYTTDGGLFYVKGENVKTGGYQAIFPVAEIVANSVHFKGPKYSQGDARIDLLSKRRGGTGSAPTWRWACADHHLMLVISALAAALGIGIAETAERDAIVDEQADLLSLIQAK